MDAEAGPLPLPELDLAYLAESGVGGQQAAWEEAVQDGVAEGASL